MREVSRPSYRPLFRGHDSRPSRVIFITCGALPVIVIISALGWSLTRGSPTSAPLIEAEVRPIKVRPDNPGGLRFSNQDVAIFEGMRSAQSITHIGLGPEMETPRLDQLRAAVSR
jgi:hypothetical protein